MPDRNFGLRHSWFLERQEQWKYNSDHYIGAAKLTEEPNEYLPQFTVEGEKGYTARVKRSKGLYYNLLKLALHVYQAQLFRIDPSRELPKTVEPAEKDADMYGTTANEFFESVSELAQRDGTHFVLVDSPKTRGQGQVRPSVAEEQSMRLRPWFESLDASRIVDWQVETQDTKRRGMLNYIVIYDPEVTRGKQPFIEGRKVERYRVYTPDKVVFYEVSRDKQGELKEEKTVDITNELGEVPIVAFYDKFKAPMKGETIMDDVAMAANSLWNSASVADESYFQQGFAIFCMFTEKDVTEVKVGESRGLGFARGDSADFKAPPPVAKEIHESRVHETLERVADMVFSRTSRQLPTAQVESAEKRDLDRQEFLALLERKAGNNEKSEAKCWALLARAWGASDTEAAKVEVEYNRDFRVDDRAADEWMKECEAGIFSLAEWYMARHPKVTDEEEAWERVKDNLKRNREASPTFSAMQGMRDSVTATVGEGGEPEAGDETSTGAGSDEESEGESTSVSEAA